MPGFDQLIGTLGGHLTLWWNVQIVEVLNQSYWPDLASTHGITSITALESAQDSGAASRTLPTNVFLEFQAE